MEIIALERVMSILKVATNHLTTQYLIVKLTILSRSHPHYITRLALIPPFVATKVNHTKHVCYILKGVVKLELKLLMITYIAQLNIIYSVGQNKFF